ncbi:phospho-sugar mutase [uncultured Holdemanella sp.]|uniref:phospho-sugar mutase n=1 Tax=uncultured Holdemanella sp. TaxID=1763549 RepID=UPI0025EBD026|nr:phospho-sugar mutase [uncultured Holdemanella sp.]
MDELVKSRYQYWLEHINESEVNALKNMIDTEIENSFYKELSFGTGGIRGKMGLGTAKINGYVIQRATQGLANYLKKYCSSNNKVIIGYDTRNHSKEYAQVTSRVLKANGFQAFLFKEALPTPCVSFAVRELKCACGIVITASHNPAEYNGYKVYNQNGCQITTEAAALVYHEIKKLDYFTIYDDSEYSYVDDIIYEKYIDAVEKESILPIENKDVSIVYTPLNGTGLRPVTDILKRKGFTNIQIVKEQEMPDGNFPTCKKPNPEEYEALNLGIEYAKRYQSDLVLATDPDCDRLSIAIRIKDNFQILSANELGCLLLDYVCQNITCVNKPVFIKTIVTTDLAELIAKKYNATTINTLTGFKFIGEQIDILKKQNRENDFIFGFEESCGFLKGTYVRDKDATVAAMLVCEMYAYYKSKDISLIERLNELYNEFGYCLNVQHSLTFDGAIGQAKIEKIMDGVRYVLQTLANSTIVLKKDYLNGIDGLPKSNVIKVFLDDKNSIIFRPSGTEPKIKIYFSIISKDKESALQIKEKLYFSIISFINSLE